MCKGLYHIRECLINGEGATRGTLTARSLTSSTANGASVRIKSLINGQGRIFEPHIEGRILMLYRGLAKEPSRTGARSIAGPEHCQEHATGGSVATRIEPPEADLDRSKAGKRLQPTFRRFFQTVKRYLFLLLTNRGIRN